MILSHPAFWAAVGYLLGSIPFGLLLARARGIDLRQIGSGSIGATNVLRTGNRGMAAATVLLDGGKGIAALLLARHFAGEPAAIAAGFAAFIGHCYPVWLGLRGGKGVATMLGVALAGVPLAGVTFALVWLGGALSTRHSSVGGMAGAIAAPVAALLLGRQDWAVALAAMAVLLIFRHRDNIARLRAGTESRIGGR